MTTLIDTLSFHLWIPLPNSFLVRNVLWWGIPNLLGLFWTAGWGSPERVRESNVRRWGIIRVLYQELITWRCDTSAKVNTFHEFQVMRAHEIFNGNQILGPDHNTYHWDQAFIPGLNRCSRIIDPLFPAKTMPTRGITAYKRNARHTRATTGNRFRVIVLTSSSFALYSNLTYKVPSAVR